MQLNYEGYGTYRGEEDGVILHLGHVIIGGKVIVRGEIISNDKKFAFDTEKVLDFSGEKAKKS